MFRGTNKIGTTIKKNILQPQEIRKTGSKCSKCLLVRFTESKQKTFCSSVSLDCI